MEKDVKFTQSLRRGETICYWWKRMDRNKRSAQEGNPVINHICIADIGLKKTS